MVYLYTKKKETSFHKLYLLKKSMLSFAIVSKDHQPTNPVSSLNMNKLDFYDFMVLTVLAYLFHFSLFFTFVLYFFCLLVSLFYTALICDMIRFLYCSHNIVCCLFQVEKSLMLIILTEVCFFPTSKFQNIQPFFIVWLWWIGIFPLSLYIKCSVEWFF